MGGIVSFIKKTHKAPVDATKKAIPKLADWLGPAVVNALGSRIGIDDASGQLEAGTREVDIVGPGGAHVRVDLHQAMVPQFPLLTVDPVKAAADLGHFVGWEKILKRGIDALLSKKVRDKAIDYVTKNPKLAKIVTRVGGLGRASIIVSAAIAAYPELKRISIAYGERKAKQILARPGAAFPPSLATPAQRAAYGAAARKRNIAAGRYASGDPKYVKQLQTINKQIHGPSMRRVFPSSTGPAMASAKKSPSTRRPGARAAPPPVRRLPVPWDIQPSAPGFEAALSKVQPTAPVYHETPAQKAWKFVKRGIVKPIIARQKAALIARALHPRPKKQKRSEVTVDVQLPSVSAPDLFRAVPRTVRLKQGKRARRKKVSRRPKKSTRNTPLAALWKYHKTSPTEARLNWS